MRKYAELWYRFGTKKIFYPYGIGESCKSFVRKRALVYRAGTSGATASALAISGILAIVRFFGNRLAIAGKIIE